VSTETDVILHALLNASVKFAANALGRGFPSQTCAAAWADLAAVTAVRFARAVAVRKRTDTLCMSVLLLHPPLLTLLVGRAGAAAVRVLAAGGAAGPADQ
jgi:hypothetical protein